MGSRSRKRGRTARPGERAPRVGRSDASPLSGPEPERHGAAGSAEAPPSARAVKTEAKNQAVREQLEPLPKGERPPWVTYGAILAAVLGVANVGLYAAGVEVANATFRNAVVGGGILLVCAVGMWRAKYWAVMGFEVLMGITTAFGAISLLVASSLRGALIAGTVVLVGGTFFWKLIRAMARIQMPERPGARSA